MKINVVNEKPEKVKTKLLILPEKSNEESIDIVKGRFSAERTVKINLKKFSSKSMRKLGAKAVKISKDFKQDEFSIAVPKTENPEEDSQSIAEGIILAEYSFDRFKTKSKKTKIKKVDFVVQENIKEVKTGVKTGEIISKYVYLARDFVNNPSNHETPSAFANRIADASKKNKLKIKIYNQKAIENMGMGCLLGVASGSREEPKIIVVEYKGNRKKDFYALIGKGVTFDSGGISLKPSDKMHEMKGDMAGAAVVAAAINAIAELKLPVNITAVIPCVENMPGGNAMKPGDILLSMSGKTVEVINTDAEGRLIMADTIHYISKEKPKAIIDIATLTGACTVALGYETSGLFGNNEKLMDKIFEAGNKVDEHVWKLPISREHQRAIKSDLADIKNMGYDTGAGGASTAAAFLKEFTNGIDWAHIDIGGAFWAKNDKKYLKKGATGWGVRLFVEFFNNKF